MAMTGTEKAEESSLPKTATIKICEAQPTTMDRVEVTPNGGRIHFQNEDQEDYGIRFWKTGMEETSGIDIVLPARGSITVAIKQDDEFGYRVMLFDNGGKVSTGKGGGPIGN